MAKASTKPAPRPAAVKPAAPAREIVYPSAPAHPAGPHQSECLHLFGSPLEAGFGARNIVSVAPPFPMRMGGLAISRIQINKIAADSLKRVLARVWDESGHDPKTIAAVHADQFSGSWVVREMRGLRAMSMHAYGLAVDFDAAHNALGDATPFFKPGNLLVRSFVDEGWTWGGAWSRCDAMHFQYAIVG